ncbi:MAG: TrbI/VirB10 family protein [Bryobacteraceae bacterium]
MTDSPKVPQIEDKRPRITGLLPRNAQSTVLGGVALLMILVILFSNRTPPRHASAGMAIPSIADPNQTHIQDFRAHIEEETRKLAAEEAELVQTKRVLGVSESAPMRQTAASTSHQSFDLASTPRAKRESESLFASNIALSYRREQSDVSDRSSVGHVTPAPPPDANTENHTRATATYRLLEGTILETVLTNRLDSSFSGPVNCMVTTNLYSHDGQKLLIPQGTRVLGEVRKVENVADQRLAIVFHRLIMPDGFSVNLDQFKALDQVGETGLRDQVNHHYLQVFGVSIALGGLAGLSQANTHYGIDESASDAYRQGIGQSLSQSALHILDRYLNVLPTFTVREGYRIKVYLSQDLLLPAYEDHPAGSEF